MEKSKKEIGHPYGLMVAYPNMLHAPKICDLSKKKSTAKKVL
jgi:hypothetical protein